MTQFHVWSRYPTERGSVDRHCKAYRIFARWARQVSPAKQLNRSRGSSRQTRAWAQEPRIRWDAHWRHLLVNTIERSCALAMRPYVKLLWPLFVSAIHHIYRPDYVHASLRSWWLPIIGVVHGRWRFISYGLSQFDYTEIFTGLLDSADSIREPEPGFVGPNQRYWERLLLSLIRTAWHQDPRVERHESEFRYAIAHRFGCRCNRVCWCYSPIHAHLQQNFSGPVFGLFCFRDRVMHACVQTT